jgi:zinc transporter ZupT
MNFAFYLLLIFAATLAGGMLPLFFKQAKRFVSRAVFFAAGILVGTGLFHLLPESIEIVGTGTGLPILIGFAVFYIPQKFMFTHPCGEDDCGFHKLGLLAFIGIAFHSFTDGIGVGAVAGKPEIHVVTAAIMSHKIPAALALSLILTGAGYTARKTGLYVCLFSLAAPLGAVATLFFLQKSGDYWLGMALGFSAGNFLAIAGSDLVRRLHEKHQEHRVQHLIFLALGCLVSLIA